MQAKPQCTVAKPQNGTKHRHFQKQSHFIRFGANQLSNTN